MPADTQDLPEFDEVVVAGQAAEDAAPLPEAHEAEAVQEPVVNPLFEEAKAAGLEFGEDITDSDSLARFLLSQYSQQRPYAEYGRSALSNQTPAVPQQVQQEADGEEQVEGFDEHKFFSEAWNVPQLSPGAQWAIQHGLFQEGKGGLLEAAEGLEQAAMPYLKEVNDYQRSRASLHEKFAENPVQFMAEKLLPYFQHKLSSQFQELSQQSVQTYEQQSFVDKFKAEHGSWLYDKQGQFTPHGNQFNSIVSKYLEKGLDIQEATEIALKFLPPPAATTKKEGDPKSSQSPAAGAAPKQEAKDGAREGERQRDEHGRFTPAGKPAPAPKKEPSFMDNAKRRAMASHAAVGATPENTVVASEGDLDSMWTSAWNAHAGAN